MKTSTALSFALLLASLPVVAAGCGASTVEESASADASAAVDASRADSGAGSSIDGGARPDAAPRDAGPAPTDASCTPGPSILDAGVPDAAISADGGTTGACAACIVAACPTEVAACDSECECNLAANDLFTCLNSGQSAIACGQQIGAVNSPALQAVGQCAFTATQCRTPCGVSFP
jgi:hypothetical protein